MTQFGAPAAGAAGPAAAHARLTAPGAAFEIAEELVLGEPMQVFVHRHRSLGELLRASLAHADAPYVVTADSALTFREHAAQVAALAAALREEYAVRPGDRVAILAANRPEWIVAFWAVVGLGAIAVGMNSMWAPPEARHGLELTDPVVVVADEERATVLRAAGTAVPVVTMDEDLPRLVERHRGAPLPDVAVDEDDPAVILFTSGTSGRAKGATHSHRNVIGAVWFHLFNDAMAAELGAPQADRRCLMVSPLFHIAALHNLAVIRLVVGDVVVLHRGRFDVDAVLTLIEKERVTNWGAVPTMLSRVVNHPRVGDYDLSALRWVSVNSAPSGSALRDRLGEVLPHLGQVLGTSYGLTESSTAATVASAADVAAQSGTVGRPVPTMELQVRDADGQVLPDGVEGEVFLRGPLVMLGYWVDGAPSDVGFAEHRWFGTGDLGSLHDGALTLSARRSDLILRGGENIYPAEVENVLASHPDVLECAVIGVPDPDLGQVVGAVVVLREEARERVTAADLAAHVRAGLAAYKVPTRWTVGVEALPRNATGKVRRAGLSLDGPG